MPSQKIRTIRTGESHEAPDTVSRSFTSAFVLDKTKLTRMLNIIEDRYKAENLEFRPSFTVVHKDNKKVNLAIIDDLFALDNTTRNPISLLGVNAKQETLHCVFGFRNSSKHNIQLSVRVAGRPKLASQIFAEVEEQIERTFSRDLVNKYLKGGKFGASSIIDALIPIIGFVSVAAVFIALLFSSGDNKSKLRELYQKAEQSNNINDKIEFIYAQQAHEFSKDDINFSSFKPSGFLNLRNLFVALPGIVILGCLVYLVSCCYPRAVFLWGDAEESYAAIVRKKRFIWSTIVLALVVGIMGNLFVYGISNHL